jgi:hypothetical protein
MGKIKLWTIRRKFGANAQCFSLNGYIANFKIAAPARRRRPDVRFWEAVSQNRIIIKEWINGSINQ